MRGVRRGCVRLRGAIIGIDDEVRVVKLPQSSTDHLPIVTKLYDNDSKKNHYMGKPSGLQACKPTVEGAKREKIPRNREGRFSG